MNETAKHIVDTLSVGTLVATLLDHLPDITALAVFVWTCLRIWESMLTIRAKRKMNRTQSKPELRASDRGAQS